MDFGDEQIWRIGACNRVFDRKLIGDHEMAEPQPADEQRGENMDTEQGLLIQQEQPTAPKRPQGGISSQPGSSSSVEASLNPAATGAPAPGSGKKPGYCSENGYLMELSRQERRRIQQEINKRFKPGEVGRLCQTECRSCSYMCDSTLFPTKGLGTSLTVAQISYMYICF